LSLIPTRQLDDNRFLVLFRRSGRGKVSGVDIAQLAGAEGADVLHLHDGKVIKWLSYWERERALADLGLAEWGCRRRAHDDVSADTRDG
jgi:hypothetical protein